jgi:protein phosphatase
MEAYAVSDVGRERSINQDFFYCSKDAVGKLPNLFIIADGMGGHKAGDLASRFTVNHLVNLIEESEYRDPVTIISHAIRQVNTMLVAKAAESTDYNGMGTTLVVATIEDHVLKVANVGDSRLYMVNEEINQITRDHSLVEEMVSIGELNRNEARHHANKNIITRAIGGSNEVEPEIFAIDLLDGDKILMCTDGLTNMVEDGDILKVINHSDSTREACETLIEQANANGGRDNITALLIEV